MRSLVFDFVFRMQQCQVVSRRVPYVFDKQRILLYFSLDLYGLNKKEASKMFAW